MYFLIISESDLVSRYGEFTITNRNYMDDLANSSSPKYTNMYAEVSEIVSVTYNTIKKVKHVKISPLFLEIQVVGLGRILCSSILQLSLTGSFWLLK